MRKNWLIRGRSTVLNILPMKPNEQKSIKNLTDSQLCSNRQLVLAFNLPRVILGSLLQGRALHGGHKALFGDDVILKLDVVRSPVLGVHHQKGKVEGLFGSPLNTIHPVAWITWNTRRHELIHVC